MTVKREPEAELFCMLTRMWLRAAVGDQSVEGFLLGMSPQMRAMVGSSVRRLFADRVSDYEPGIDLSGACDALGIPILYRWSEQLVPKKLEPLLLAEFKPYNEEEHICGNIINFEGLRCMIVCWFGNFPCKENNWNLEIITEHIELTPAACIDLNR